MMRWSIWRVLVVLGGAVGCLLPCQVYGQQVKLVEKMPHRIQITLADGILDLEPISDSAIHVTFHQLGAVEETSQILRGSLRPRFKVFDEAKTIMLTAARIQAEVNRVTGAISFKNNTGRVVLQETALGRRVLPFQVQGKPCFVVEQSFLSPKTEHIYGLGQFQDGQFNIRGLTRRLLQVDSQISIPFIYSSEGYGLLWHQYGTTEFNPTEGSAVLTKEEGPQTPVSMEVSGPNGAFRRSGKLESYTGQITVTGECDVGFFIDYGTITSLHNLEIDGRVVIHNENLCLPPSVGVQMHLKAGLHQIKVQSIEGTPNVSWRLATDTMTFRSPHASMLDYIVITGKSGDDIISSYRAATGSAPILPRWAYGFWQSKERYESQRDLVNAALEYRDRKIPLDAIVQDWQYWPKAQWASLGYDLSRYPNPSGMVKDLLANNVHLILTLLTNLSKDSGLGMQFLQKGFYIPNSNWLDLFNPDARKAYWAAIDKNLNSTGIAGWCLNGTEPENDGLLAKTTFFGPGEQHRLMYSLYASKTIYDGQRVSSPSRRVCILNRSSYPGEQRYGTIAWSGDVGSTWDSYRRQIKAGLSYSMSGMPYWTSDIGGFYRSKDSPYTDPKYQELLTRWFQFGTFNPILRVHGFEAQTELWKFGADFEKNARCMLDLRYRLLPYIYSVAWNVANDGASFMRALPLAFLEDPVALDQTYEFMFGPALLVSPVTEADTIKMDTYLPVSPGGWYNFWTGEKQPGGKNVSSPAPLTEIPLFVQAGSIIPMGPKLQFSEEKVADPLEIRVYAGADGSFRLFEDEGDGYGYEKGAFTSIPFTWVEKTHTLTIGVRAGQFRNMLKRRIFHVILVGPRNGTGIEPAPRVDLSVQYEGKESPVVLIR